MILGAHLVSRSVTHIRGKRQEAGSWLAAASSLIRHVVSPLFAIPATPKQVCIDDVCKAAGPSGCVHEDDAGSHLAFARTGEPVGLNFQNRGGFIPPYPVRQLPATIEKYADSK